MTETPVKSREEETETETVTVARADKAQADAPVTIAEVFDLPKAGEKDPQPDRWEIVEQRIKKEVKDVKFPAALHDLGPKICELFNVPLPDVMVTSWKKVAGLQALLEKSRNSPDEVMYLELAAHSINSEHKPHLEMRIKDLPVKKIEFVVKLVFNLKGFVLKVKAGAIQEIQTGACEVKGTISYAGNVIVDKKLTPIKLPGAIPVPAALGLLKAPPVQQAKTATAT
jgi:phosphoenolpyruvate synthase/pyruvate phosphate dikinase